MIGVTGSVTITATSELFADGTVEVEVVEPALDIVGLNTTTTTDAVDDAFYVRTGYVHTNGTTFRLQNVSPPNSIQVLLTSSDVTVGQLVNSASSGESVTVEVPVNSYNSPNTVATGGVAFDPMAEGTTTISASANGIDKSFSLSSEDVTVSLP